GLLLADIPLIGYALEATYRWPYRLDARNSAFGAVKAFPQNVEVGSLLNFAIERPPVPPLMPSPVPIPPAPPPLPPPDLPESAIPHPLQSLHSARHGLPPAARRRPRRALPGHVPGLHRRPLRHALRALRHALAFGESRPGRGAFASEAADCLLARKHDPREISEGRRRRRADVEQGV